MHSFPGPPSWLPPKRAMPSSVWAGLNPKSADLPLTIDSEAAPELLPLTRELSRIVRFQPAADPKPSAATSLATAAPQVLTELPPVLATIVLHYLHDDVLEVLRHPHLAQTMLPWAGALTQASADRRAVAQAVLAKDLAEVVRLGATVGLPDRVEDRKGQRQHPLDIAFREETSALFSAMLKAGLDLNRACFEGSDGRPAEYPLQQLLRLAVTQPIEARVFIDPALQSEQALHHVFPTHSQLIPDMLQMLQSADIRLAHVRLLLDVLRRLPRQEDCYWFEDNGFIAYPYLDTKALDALDRIYRAQFEGAPDPESRGHEKEELGDFQSLILKHAAISAGPSEARARPSTLNAWADLGAAVIVYPTAIGETAQRHVGVIAGFERGAAAEPQVIVRLDNKEPQSVVRASAKRCIKLTPGSRRYRETDDPLQHALRTASPDLAQRASLMMAGVTALEYPEVFQPDAHCHALNKLWRKVATMHDLAPMLLAQTHADLARETILRLPQQTNPVLDYFATEFAKRAHAHYGSPLEAEVTRSAAWLSGNLRAVRKAEMPAKPG